MSEEKEKESSSEMSLSEKLSVISGSDVFSSVSAKSDKSREEPPGFSEETPSLTIRFQNESFDSDFQTGGNQKNFKDNLLLIFQDLENKMIPFLKNELEKFRKILQKENIQYFAKDFNENRCDTKEAALDLTLSFLREMKQDEAAETLEDELIFIHQLKCSLKKKYQCVSEGIAKHGDSTLLNNIYTDLYITQGGNKHINTEHEVRQIEVASRHHESQEIQVECTKMFQAPEQDKEIRTVLTKGVAGIGKTISVQKFVLDWAEGKENQDIRFIFPLPFRELNLKEKETQSMISIISQFFPETKRLNLTRRNRYKILFILDGLDECRLPLNFDGNETLSDVSSPASLDVLLTNLIKGNLLRSAVIWITTRPAAASKIPPDCINRETEVRGFNDAQKEEYFKKRFTDQNIASEIIDHVKKSKSLFIMCHIPVFCWISATVLQNILEEKKKYGLKKNQADDASKTQQEPSTEDIPKTLTQMYTHFLRFQILQSRRKYDGQYAPDVSWDKDAIHSLGKLAFHQLERNNLIFYDTDLEACGIDIYKASVYSGMCTQIFKEETGIVLGTMYCFVHLSIQEFIAALYAHLFLDINKKCVFVHDSAEQKNKNETMIDLLKTAVDKALESDNGHLDLFLRFLLGLSLQSNRLLLRGLLTQQDGSDQSKKEIVQYIKLKLENNLSAERSINLFYCLNELNDQTLVKEIQTHLSKGSLSSSNLSPAQWSALAFVLLTSEEELEEFDLQKFKKSDECLIRLSAVIKTSKRALLNDCHLTDKSCPALATVLGSDTKLKELNMNNNSLQDSGVKHLCTGLRSVNCKLEILRLNYCELTEKSCSVLATVLSSKTILKEMDLSNSRLLDSGVKDICEVLKNPVCELKILKLCDCGLTEESCSAFATVLRSNSSLKELDMSDNNLQDSGVKKLQTGLENTNCTLEKLKFSDCSITEEGYKALASALRSNPLHLTELDLTGNDPGQSGVEELHDLLQDPNFQLKTLRLSNCSITEEGYKALASALRSNPSHLIELDLTGNDPGQSGVKDLDDLLQDPNCQLKTLRFLGPAADEACQFVAGIVGKNPLLLRELNLSQHELGDSGVNQIAALLQDKHCTLNALILWNCSITEKQFFILTSALKSNLSHLKELDLSGNQIKDTGVNHLCGVLKDSHCKLERLRLSCCFKTDEGCSALTSALKSNPLHLRELNLSGNELGDSGVKNLSDLLMNPQCKLERIHLCECSITEKQCLFLTSALKSNPSHLRELDFSRNELKYTCHLCDILKGSHCKVERLRLRYCDMTDEGCSALTSALKSNPSHLRELNLSMNELGDSGVKNLSDLLMNPQCKLEIVDLSGCGITDEQGLILTSALKSNPSHLKELNLSENKINNTGVNHLSDILKDPHCKLERLSLNFCGITDVSSLSQSLTNTKALQFLKELNLRNNTIGDSKKKLTDVLRASNCELK
ncbi:NACHT, LRR and PYD domains-containing protein 3-like [Garra rufa]|uniref:NACHT, LRR and PYD domains-containing protein 3-like n=1 Tax=Garra rufa TaxID=137080 RepID=UPI003CCE5907